MKKEVHHPNDVTIRYLLDIMPEKLHRYFNLPGIFVKNYPTRLIKRDGSEREMDWLFLVEPDNKTLFEKILINVEFQSSHVGKDKIRVFGEYKDYSKTYYGFPVLTIVIIIDGYESSELEYSRVESDILRPIYIRIREDEIIERLNNIEEKINNIEKLNDNEALDMVFLPMFAPKNRADSVTETIVNFFSKDKSLNGVFRNDIGFALSIMVRKYFDLTSKGKELLDMMREEVVSSRLRDVVDFEVDYIRRAYEKELEEKDSALAEKDHALAEKDHALAEKDAEISRLKAKLNGKQ